MRSVIAGILAVNVLIGGVAMAGTSLPQAPGAVPQAYSLPNTQVRELQSKANNAIYRLFIATPPDYATSGKRYPIVYMLDADYSFALTRNIVQHFVERGKLPEMILVAIAYPGAADDMEVYQSNRKRDYTPSAALRVGFSADGSSGHNGQGGADGFRAFIADELVPFIEANYPAAPDRTFIGHSYGGLFGTYVLLTTPDLFRRYVIVSPSLWFDNALMLKVEKQVAARTIHAHAYFAIGSRETRATTGAPMVQQLKQFTKQLAAQRSSGLEITLDVREGETHDSIFPGAVTRGLITVFQDAPRST